MHPFILCTHSLPVYAYCLMPLQPFFVSQERIRTYMNRVKEITDKKKAARLDKGAAARFVRNALYEHEEKDPKKKAASKKAGNPSDAVPSKRQKRS